MNLHNVSGPWMKLGQWDEATLQMLLDLIWELVMLNGGKPTLAQLKAALATSGVSITFGNGA